MNDKIFIKNRNDLKILVKPHILPGSQKLVFIEHGLSGSSNEAHIKEMEKAFSILGYSTVLFDATNSTGDSDLSKEGITFTSHYHDLIDVIDWAKTQPFFVSPFALTGHSIGGTAVTLYAEEHPDDVHLLIPIAPSPSGTSLENSRKTRDLVDFEAWKKNGFYDKTSQTTGKTLHIPFSFLEDMRHYDLMPLAHKIKCKTVIIIGNKEDSSRLSDVNLFYEKLMCPKAFILLPDTPHVPTPDNMPAFILALNQAIKD